MGRFDLQPKKPKKTQAQPATEPVMQATATPRVRGAGSSNRRRPARNGTFMRGLISGVVTFIALAIFGIGAALIGYAAIASASDLPTADQLDEEGGVSSFQSLRILDREGNLLSDAFDPTQEDVGRRTEIESLSQISRYLVDATVATEDANFYQHRGVDPVALLRALYYAVRERDIVSGASTIPQQLVKMVWLTPEQTLTRKVKEAILASEISRTYEKEEILRLYLNELYYGNLAYGVAAAAETYFGKDAADLTLSEASLLAGLPQLPAYYDPYTHRDRARERQAVVLGLMVESGYITEAEADAAWLEELNYAPLDFDMKSPHFTLYVRQQLESIISASSLYQTGLTVETTLDPDLQAAAESIVADQVARLAGRNVSNGALVAMRPDTGEIVALVGSADFDNVEIDGQINMALAPRQPGSSIKPFVYLAAFEQPEKPVGERWTPGTLIADIKREFPDGVNPPYVPTNYDMREHGMVTVRAALANSYNIPAVAALQQVELPDFLGLMQRLGATTLNRGNYGLSLSLGGGEVPLLEMTGAFAVLANQGVRTPPVVIRKVTDSKGDVLCEIGTDSPCLPPGPGAGQQVVSPIDAFLITDILSDNEARVPAFGPNSVLQLDRPAAVKTGTTNDFRDNLTLGYTPQLVTGVWIGNADYTQMQDISGVSGAGPIWSEFMTFAHQDVPVEQFTVPPGVRQVEVCRDTGTLPSPACPEKRRYWFAEDRPPLPAERDLYQIVRLDRTTGKLANEFTPRENVEEKVFKVYPEAYREWAAANGIPQPPFNPNDAVEIGAQLYIRQPVEGEVVGGVVQIIGSANTPNFRNYELQYGISHDPGAFSAPFAGNNAPVVDNVLGQWDTRELGEGPHTLRLLVYDNDGNVFESRIRLFVAAATPTPQPTLTWTPPPVQPTPTETLVPEQPTAIPTDTPLPAAPTVESPPTNTPLPTNTPPVQQPPAEQPPTETPTAPPAEQPPTETPVVGEPATPTPAPTATDIPPEALPPTETPTALPAEQPPAEESAEESGGESSGGEASTEPTPTWTPIPGAQGSTGGDPNAEAATVTETITETTPLTATQPLTNTQPVTP